MKGRWDIFSSDGDVGMELWDWSCGRLSFYMLGSFPLPLFVIYMTSHLFNMKVELNNGNFILGGYCDFCLIDRVMCLSKDSF